VLYDGGDSRWWRRFLGDMMQVSPPQYSHKPLKKVISILQAKFPQKISQDFGLGMKNHHT
jgi:hypothetical protein